MPDSVTPCHRKGTYVWCRTCAANGREALQYVWSGRCEIPGGFQHVVEHVGDTEDDVKAWGRRTLAKETRWRDAGSTSNRGERRGRKRERYLGRNMPMGVPTSFGVLTAYYVPPRADDLEPKMPNPNPVPVRKPERIPTVMRVAAGTRDGKPVGRVFSDDPLPKSDWPMASWVSYVDKLVKRINWECRVRGVRV